MHQRIAEDPIKESKDDVNLWRYYLAENVQWAVDRMPMKNFLNLLFSESTVGIKVLPGTTDRMGTLGLEVTGECFDAFAAIECKLQAADLSSTEKKRILDLVKLYYPITREPSRGTPKKVARALGLVYK